MRFIRNVLCFFAGVVLVTGCSALINSAYAVGISGSEFSTEMAELTLETNSVIVTSTLGVAFCLGWVAGSFR